MNLLINIVPAFIFLFLVYQYNLRSFRRRVGPGKLPPGPKGLPLVGNLLEIPPKHSWLKFKEWSDQYGPIYRLNIAGWNHVILSTDRVATDVLVKRGAYYSSRGGITSLSEGMAKGYAQLVMDNNELWRRHRKLGNSLLSQSALTKYSHIQSEDSAVTLLDLLTTPAMYERHIERYAAAILFRMGMGKRVHTGNEDYVRFAYYLIHLIEKVGSPGANLCDIFPILWRLPAWLYTFKQQLWDMHAKEDQFYFGLQKEVQDQTSQGTATDCWLRTFLQTSSEEFELTGKEGRWAIGNYLTAGTPTTAAALMSLLFAFVQNPEWLRKTQREVDRVVEVDRLPEQKDIENLPTVRAVVKETLRWRPVTAGGIPHMLTKDDVYDGYFLPKGSLVHANQWAIHRDPDLYPDPEHFRPDRWLEPSFPTYQEPLTVYPNLQGFSAFGYGRRICPGINLVEKSVNLLTARIAWGCDIRKQRDADTGVEVDVPVYDYTQGFNTQPKPFRFELQSRSEKKLALLRNMVGDIRNS